MTPGIGILRQRIVNPADYNGRVTQQFLLESGARLTVSHTSDNRCWFRQTIPYRPDAVPGIPWAPNNSLVYFLRDVTLVSGAAHPGLVPLEGWNVSIDPNELTLITPFYPPLSSLKSIILSDRLRVLYGVARTMAFLHANDIIHGNLVPESISLDNDRPLVGWSFWS
jgi:serine/threonine protein kinase